MNYLIEIIILIFIVIIAIAAFYNNYRINERIDITPRSKNLWRKTLLPPFPSNADN